MNDDDLIQRAVGRWTSKARFENPSMDEPAIKQAMIEGTEFANHLKTLLELGNEISDELTHHSWNEPIIHSKRLDAIYVATRLIKVQIMCGKPGPEYDLPKTYPGNRPIPA